MYYIFKTNLDNRRFWRRWSRFDFGSRQMTNASGCCHITGISTFCSLLYRDFLRPVFVNKEVNSGSHLLVHIFFIQFDKLYWKLKPVCAYPYNFDVYTSTTPKCTLHAITRLILKYCIEPMHFFMHEQNIGFHTP